MNSITNHESHSHIEVKFFNRFPQLIEELISSATACDSWWVCLGSNAAGKSINFWNRLTTEAAETFSRLEVAVLALNSDFNHASLLKVLHNSGSLRVMSSPLEASVFGFRLSDSYVFSMISGWECSSLFEGARTTAILISCGKDHPCVYQTEEFRTDITKRTRILTKAEIEEFEKESIFLVRNGDLDWSPTQLGKKITEILGSDRINRLRASLGVKSLNGQLPAKLVNQLMQRLEIQYWNNELQEFVPAERFRILAKHTALRRSDGSQIGYLRWNNDIIAILESKIRHEFGI